MSDLSNYAEKKLLDHLLGVAAFTMPATVYLALFTAVTDAEAGTGTEVSGSGYARQPVTFNATTLGSGATDNPGAITFTASGGNFGTVTHAALFDAVSAGNPLTAIKALAASKIVNDGDSLAFAIGDIDVALA